MKKMSIGKRQGGAVAIMVGISMFMLMAFLGLVLDLGPLYVGKTELQNAADAAALSGAKELKGDLDGISKAEVAAIDTFDQQNFKVPPWVDDDFAKPATTDRINEDNIWVGNCPDDDCMVPIADIGTDAEAADKTFLKVDSGKRQIHAWIMSIFGQNMTSTFGLAVAGRYVVSITPLGVCAVDWDQDGDIPDPAVNPGGRESIPGNNELVEWGFRRGVAYRIPELNPLGAAGAPMWINPVDSPPGACDPNHSSTAFTAPFVCEGSTSTISALPGEVYVSTGTSSALEKALNSRFDIYLGSPCDPVSAPPDVNIRQYRCTDNSNPNDCGQTAETNLPKDWMEPANDTTPTRQTIRTEPGLNGRQVPVGDPNPPPSSAAFVDYGALWSYGPAVSADASTPPEPGTPFALGDWTSLYGGVADTTATGYPATGSPYAQTSGSKYFDAPDVHEGKADRRVLNVAILDCDSLSGFPGGGLSCAQVDVVGIGKFFMQVPADFSGSPKRIEGEFAGLIDQLPPADIRLYR